MPCVGSLITATRRSPLSKRFCAPFAGCARWLHAPSGAQQSRLWRLALQGSVALRDSVALRHTLCQYSGITSKLHGAVVLFCCGSDRQSCGSLLPLALLVL